MNPASPSAPRRALFFLSALAVSACATGMPDVEPVDIPRLEQQIAAKPADTDLQVQLGMAQYKAADYDVARATLQNAIDAGNESGPAFLYLGMVQEELEDWSGAREAYGTYLNIGASTEARALVRRRLTLIGRNLLQAQARQALAQEAEITRTGAITPQSVAVLPMGFNSENADLEPLIYALSDMMVTDFKVSNALVVLERAQIQSLLDEMALTSAGYAEPGTGARAGRLLRAEHVFQGVLTTLGANELQTDADILNIPNTTSAGQVTSQAALEQLFDMEKDIVIRSIREVLGIELTPAEEQSILDNRMGNVLAFLSYGRGLRELDRGNYAAARAEFENAVVLEGGSFAAGDLALAETAALAEAESSSTGELAGVASTTGETGAGFFGPPSAGTTADVGAAGISPQQPVGAAAQGNQGGGVRSNTLRSIAEGVDPTPGAGMLNQGTAQQGQDQTTAQTNDTSRDPTQEAGGGETVGMGAEAQIRIVIRRPGGDR